MKAVAEWGMVAIMYSAPLLVMALFLIRKAHPSRPKVKAFVLAFGILAAFLFGTIAVMVAITLAGAAIFDASGVPYQVLGPNDPLRKAYVGAGVGGILGALFFGWRTARSRITQPPNP